MSEVNMFEAATRGRIRFEHKGVISVEELWLLSLSELNSVYKSLKSQENQAGEENLFNDDKSQDEVAAADLLKLKIEIVKHIATVKKTEKDAKENEAANKALEQKILNIKAKRADAALVDASDEELDKMLSELKK